MAAGQKAGMVIVGAGECGVRAALALREGGYDGPVVLVGSEPHAPYERPPLSKETMAEESPLPKTIASRESLDQAGIEWIGGIEAVAIDREGRQVGLADGRSLPYDKLLLATGRRAAPTTAATGTGLRRLSEIL